MSHAVPLFEKMLHCDWNGWARYDPQVDARLLFIALSHQFILEPEPALQKNSHLLSVSALTCPWDGSYVCQGSRAR